MSEPQHESAAETAARVFETQRLNESTPEAVRSAVDAVGSLFIDDEAKTRAAARIAEGFPAGLSVEAARRLVVYSLSDPAFKEYLKPEPTALDRAKAHMDVQRRPVGPPPLAAPRPRTLAEMAEAIRARRSPLLYPATKPTEPQG